MSETAIEETHGAGDAHAHPTDLSYVKIGLFLAFLTGAEVSTYSFGLHGAWVVVLLIMVMVVKFGVVAAFFMHLRFDKKILTWVFYAGLTLAVLVYIAVLSMFRIWYPGRHT